MKSIRIAGNSQNPFLKSPRSAWGWMIRFGIPGVFVAISRRPRANFLDPVWIWINSEYTTDSFTEQKKSEDKPIIALLLEVLSLLSPSLMSQKGISSSS